MSWNHHGKERLFTSPKAVFRPGCAIRGGVPVIFPQFGGSGPGLRHGFARLLPWEPVGAEAAADRAILFLCESVDTLRWWPHRFRAAVEVRLLEDGLSISLVVKNHGAASFDFTVALHTYLSVSDIERARVLGLQGQHYVDAANGNHPGFQQEASLRFAGEVDRLYVDSGDREVWLQEASDTVRIRSEGFSDTVVWNPGAELAMGLTDLGAGNHTQFVCVEAACAARPVLLSPGAVWRGTQTLTCIDS